MFRGCYKQAEDTSRGISESYHNIVQKFTVSELYANKIVLSEGHIEIIDLYHANIADCSLLML